MPGDPGFRRGTFRDHLCLNGLGFWCGLATLGVMKQAIPKWLLSRLPKRQKPSGSGICTEAYHVGRERSPALKYRLHRRTAEVCLAASRHLDREPRVILDVGTADAMMLSALGGTWPSARLVGVDLSLELLKTCRDPKVDLALADAEALPVADASVDLLVATAVVEHVPRPEQVFAEMHRVLAPGGLVVITTPHPFWEELATLVGHLPDEQHHETMTIERLTQLCEGAGLDPVGTKRFMLSPVGLPLEEGVEHFVRWVGLEMLFANQLIAASRRDE